MMNIYFFFNNMIRYRKFTPSDASEVFGILERDRDIAYWCGFGQPASVEQARDYLAELSERQYWYAIVKDGRIAGCVSLSPKEDGMELGYWMASGYRRQGLMKQAIRHMLKVAREVIGTKVVYCGWFEGNEASERLQKGLGFKEYGMAEVPFATGKEHLTRKDI